VSIPPLNIHKCKLSRTHTNPMLACRRLSILNPESSETPSASKKPRKFQTCWEPRGAQTIASPITAQMALQHGSCDQTSQGTSRRTRVSLFSLGTGNS
jgi:hypothetical protein